MARTELVAAALGNAAATTLIDTGAIFHSDRSRCLPLTCLPGLGDRPGRAVVDGTDRGVPVDNSMAESFFAALKKECAYHTMYSIKAKARQYVIKYIEGFYNLPSSTFSSRIPIPERRPRQLPAGPDRGLR